MNAKLPCPGTLNKGLINLFKKFPKIFIKLVDKSSSVATKKGNKDGIIEFVQRNKPFFYCLKVTFGK